MDVRKSQTSTASPAKPGDFPIGLSTEAKLQTGDRRRNTIFSCLLSIGYVVLFFCRAFIDNPINNL